MQQENTADPKEQEPAAEPGSDTAVSASSRTEKVFRVIGLMLVVLSAPAVYVNWQILIRRIMREMDKTPDALNSQHFLVALWGDLAFVFDSRSDGFVGAFLFLPQLVLACSALGLFGAGMIASAYADAPECRGIGLRVLRRTGIAILIVSPLLLLLGWVS